MVLALPSARAFIRPRMVTILATYRCTAACTNCCFGSNPTITQRISYDTIAAFIDEAAALESVEVVVFSGGECFLLGQDLVNAVAHATSLGLSTRCVSNGYWAKSEVSGRRRLEELKGAGLKELNVSTGDFHQEYVSMQTVTNAAILSLETGFETVVMVERRLGSTVDAESVSAAISQHPRATKSGRKLKVVESPWMPMDAAESINQTAENMLNASNVHRRSGCDSIFSTVVLTPSKGIGLCCGLSRELIPELTAINKSGSLIDLLEDTASDFMLIWLLVDGPERILHWAASKNARIEWENLYSHRCHACLALFDDEEVRTTIREFYHERVDEVLLRYNVLLRQQEGLAASVYG